MSTYMRQQIDFQDELMKFAYSRQEHADMRHLQEAKDNHIPLNIGAYLVVRHEDSKAPNKLSVRWHGPYRIIASTHRPQGTVYTCYCPTTGHTYDFHATVVQFHQCTSDAECVRSKVLDDNNLFIPEKIMQHQIVNATKINLLVK
jgi:hypothetical protein